MEQAFFSDNFIFSSIMFERKYHYHDARDGSDYNYLAYMTSGHARIVSPNTTIAIKEGDAFCIPKGLPYQSYWYSDESKISWLAFAFPHLNTAENTNFALQVIPCPESTIAKIINLPTVGTQITCRILSQFYDIMSEVLPLMQPAVSGKGEQIVEEAKKYMEDHPHCSIPEAAKACMVSEPYLYDLFRHINNSTPNEYRQQILCRKGIELLRTTDKTVEEISSILNFSSGSYFRRVLLKHTGYTPKEIRGFHKL